MTRQAVNETAGKIMKNGGELVDARSYSTSGGNGYGVGMSQYGGSMLGGKGWGYERILDACYSGMQLSDIPGTSLSLTGILIGGLGPMREGDKLHTDMTATYLDGTVTKVTVAIRRWRPFRPRACLPPLASQTEISAATEG